MENKHEKMLENIKEMVFLIEDDVIKYVNSSVKNVLNYKEEDLLDKSFLSIIKEEKKEETRDLYERAKNSNLFFETEVLKKNKEVIFVEAYVEKIKKENNETIELFVLRDITAKKKTEEVFEIQEKRFHNITENTPDMIARFDEEGRYVYVNSATEKEFGIKRKDFFWKTDEDLNIANEKTKTFLTAIKSVFSSRDKKTFYSEAVIRGEQKYYYTVLIPEFFKDGTVNSVLSITRDITEIKEIDRAKTDFISITSHQLRSPLSVISWCTLLLLREEAEEEEKKEYLEKIYNSTRSLIKITDSFLNTTMLDLEMFIFNPQEVDVVDLAEGVIREFSSLIDKKTINFIKDYDVFPKITIDPRLLKIIFRATLSNAVDYTPKNGNIDFSLKNEKTEILLMIGDSGCGVSAEDRKRIFTKFYRAENARSTRAYGTGLDLYLIKSLLEKMGGSIVVESPNPKFNKGSLFLIRIPTKQ